jgi:hypothetical protein
MISLSYGSRFGLPLAGLLLCLLHASQSYCTEARTFYIAEANGYGVEDCLGEDGECGKIVANAWCEAFGRGAALKFGRSEDNTEAPSETSTGVREPYFVTCGD